MNKIIIVPLALGLVLTAAGFFTLFYRETHIDHMGSPQPGEWDYPYQTFGLPLIISGVMMAMISIGVGAYDTYYSKKLPASPPAPP
jgi:hypothetical protein